MNLSSPAFTNNGHVPPIYSCRSQGISPPLTFDDVPDGTKSLALTVDDPDAPKGDFVHWVVWNIPAGASGLSANVEAVSTLSDGTRQGKNGAGATGYHSLCPPSGTHHYYFRIYALDIKLSLPDTTTMADLLSAMKGHVLAQGELVGLFP